MKIALIGTSGSGRVLADAVFQTFGQKAVGFVAENTHRPATFAGLPFMGGIDDLPALMQAGVMDAALLSEPSNSEREQHFNRLRALCPALKLPPFVHKTAVIGEGVVLEDGVVVLAGAVIGPGCKVGRGAWLDVGSSLDHESRLGDFASLASGARTGGMVCLGARTSVGMGAMLKHRITIGPDTTIAMGSVVLKNLPERVSAGGVPAVILAPFPSSFALHPPIISAR